MIAFAFILVGVVALAVGGMAGALYMRSHQPTALEPGDPQLIVIALEEWAVRYAEQAEALSAAGFNLSGANPLGRAESIIRKLKN